MSIRTTVTLEDDVLERVREESRSRGISFRETLNDLLRSALLNPQAPTPRRPFKVKATSMGYRPGLNYDKAESLIEYGEGENHK